MRLSFGKIRAILGTSLAGGGIGALLGGVVLGASVLLFPGSVPLGLLVGGTVMMAAFGVFATGGFATMLALSPREGSVADLSVAKSAVLGVLAGSLFPSVLALMTGGLLLPIELGTLTWLGGFFGVLGGGVSAGLVAVAKASETSGLSPASSPAGLLDSTEDPRSQGP